MAFSHFGDSSKSFHNGVYFGIRQKADAEVGYHIETYGFGIYQEF